MNPRLFSNQALNGFKGMYGDIKKTFSGDGKQMTYALRNQSARQAYDNLSVDQRRNFKWKPGSIDKRRATALAGSAYVAGDATYRTLSGGSAYRNSSGESDIVGIPMI